MGSGPAWDEVRCNGVRGMPAIGLNQPVDTVDDIVALHRDRQLRHPRPPERPLDCRGAQALVSTMPADHVKVSPAM